jgi:hypothetical protein
LVVLDDAKTCNPVKKLFECVKNLEVRSNVEFTQYITEQGYTFSAFAGKNKQGETIDMATEKLRYCPSDIGYGAFLGAKGTFAELIKLVVNYGATAGVSDNKVSILDKDAAILTAFGYEEMIKGNFSRIKNFVKMLNQQDPADLGVGGLYGMSIDNKGTARQAVTSEFSFLKRDASNNLELPLSYFNSPNVLTGDYNKVFNRGIAVITPVGPAVPLTEAMLSALKNSDKLPKKGKKSGTKSTGVKNINSDNDELSASSLTEDFSY